MLHHLLRLIRTVLAEIVGVLLRKTVLDARDRKGEDHQG